MRFMEQVGSLQPPAGECQARTESREEHRDGAHIRGMTNPPPALGVMGKAELEAPCSGSTGCYEGSHNGSREQTGIWETTAVGKSRASCGLSTAQGLQAPSACQQKPSGPKPMWFMAVAAPCCFALSEPERSSTHHTWKKRSHAQRQPQAQDQYGPKEGAGLRVRPQVAPNRQGKRGQKEQ